MSGLIGKKIGMTQVFDEDGRQVPVTVVEVGPCVVVQRKTSETDGYSAIQLGFVDQKKQRLSKAAVGRFDKAAFAALARTGKSPIGIAEQFCVRQGIRYGAAIQGQEWCLPP